MLSAFAAAIAARRRGFIAGSGRPSFAATVISRASLPNSLERIASCRPLRCMMFLNWEWPATAASGAKLKIGGVIGRAFRKIQSADDAGAASGAESSLPERRARLVQLPAEPHRRDPGGEPG